MKSALLGAAAAALLSSTVAAQIMIPPHSTTYTGYSRGFSFTANNDFFINQLDLPIDAFQAGDTAGYLVMVNGVEVLRSVGNAGAIAVNIPIATGDVVGIIGNWSPAATGNFSARNSYGSGGGTYSTMIEGVATTLYRAGWQYDIADPNYTSGTYFEGNSGSMGRVLVYTNPPSGLFADFSADVTAGNAPLTVNFTDQSFSSDPGGVLTWAWDVDNDGFADYNTQNCTHTYAAEGIYDVKLVVTDAAHPAATELKTGYIEVDLVSASFTFAPAGGNTVNFTDTSSGNPTSWAWDFDTDGNVDSTLQNPSFSYPAPGAYTCTLTVMDAISNDSTSQSVGVSILDVGPFARTFSSSSLTRGFYFQTPVKFSFTSLQVPDESGHGLQNVAVYNFGATQPPAFSATVPGVPEFFAAGVASNQTIPCAVSFEAGDWVGVLGACGDASTMRSSYGGAQVPSSLLGQPVTLYRLLTQTNIVSNSGVCPISTEDAGPIGRVLCGVSAATGVSYGTGSPSAPGNAAPVLSTTMLPILGQNAELTTVLDPNDAGATVFFSVGIGRLNIPVPGVGTLYVNPFYNFNAGAGVAGANSMQFAVPASPWLAGAMLNWQNFNFGGGGLSVSNGEEWCLNF